MSNYQFKQRKFTPASLSRSQRKQDVQKIAHRQVETSVQQSHKP
jgi:hypothetical protein